MCFMLFQLSLKTLKKKGVSLQKLIFQLAKTDLIIFMGDFRNEYTFKDGDSIIS